MEKFTMYQLELDAVALFEHMPTLTQEDWYPCQKIEEDHTATYVLRDCDEVCCIHAIISIIDNEPRVAFVVCSGAFLHALKELGIIE